VSDFPSGLFLFDKPAGVTSFDCVRMVKKRLGAARAGHCGTLDPAARGLLLILLGNATRLQNSFLGLEKEYWFRAQFGIQSTTGDMEGEITTAASGTTFTQEELETILESFVGHTLQIPPLFSALKYKGKPYYHYARKGQEVPRVARPVSIGSFTLQSFANPFWEALLTCSRGTYVRTLVEDVAARLGTCATLVELVRERVGPYRRQEALTAEQLRSLYVKILLEKVQSALLERASVHA
jgi:tRNA pseudouridine55 synthase